MSALRAPRASERVYAASRARRGWRLHDRDNLDSRIFSGNRQATARDLVATYEAPGEFFNIWRWLGYFRRIRRGRDDDPHREQFQQ